MPNRQCTPSRPCVPLVLLTVASLLLTSAPVTASEAQRPVIATASEAPDAEFTMQWLVRFVQPMENELGEMPPLLAWNLPIAPARRMTEPRHRAQFEDALPKLLARGIVPTVQLWEGRGLEGPIVMARLIQAAGAPVHLEYRGLPGGERKLYESCELWVDSPDHRAGREEDRWPCLIHADPSHARQWMRQTMQRFAEAGVTVDAVWFDWEPMPTVHGGALKSQRKDPRIAAQYLEGVLDSWRSFATHIKQYECDLYSEAMADPVHAVFPDALVSNYEAVASSEAHPYLNRIGDVDLKRLSASMITLYPDNWILRNHFGRDVQGPPIPQAKADEVFWTGLMFRLSTAAPNEAADKQTMVYVTRMVQMFNAERFRIRMGKAVYHEFLRHAWLRGVDRMFLLNRGHVTHPRMAWTQRPSESFEEMEDARAVYDQMLRFREFLKRGKPMNFAWSKPFTGQPYWSGLALSDRALVRATSRDGQVRMIEIEAFQGRKFVVEAPPAGRFHLLHADGSVTELGETR